MTALQIVFGVVLIVLAIFIIALVMMQEGNQQGLGAISGGASESFFDKNKSRTNEAKIAFATKLVVGLFCIVALVTVVAMMFI